MGNKIFLVVLMVGDMRFILIQGHYVFCNIGLYEVEEEEKKKVNAYACTLALWCNACVENLVGKMKDIMLSMDIGTGGVSREKELGCKRERKRKLK